MTAAVELQAELRTGECGTVGIITEDATIISVANFEPAPQPAAIGKAEKLATENNPSEDNTADAAVVDSQSQNVPPVRRSDSDGTSSSASQRQKPVEPPTPTPVKRGRCGGWSLRRVPSWFWIALAVLVVAQALGVVGAILYARSVNRDARRAAADVARSSARAIETVLDHLIAPVMSLANLVHLQPHWPTVNESFPVFSDAIYQTNRYYQVELCPYGVVGAMAMPWMNATGNITAEEWPKILKTFDMGLDMLDPNRSSFDVEIAAILQNGSVALLGPWYADGELAEGAFVVRYSIFLPPGKWDMPPNSIEYCPHDVCNTPGGLTWWGWSNAVFAWKTVSPSLRFIQDRNLLYTLAPDPRAANQSFLAMSNKLPNPDECEVVRVDVYGWLYWTFCVEPNGGFGPSWRVGLLVGVTALAVVLAVLVGLVLRSRHQAVKYLARQLETNRQLAIAKEEAEEGRRTLEAEKRVMDALMQRQRNLIELFGKEDELMNAVADGAEASVQRRLQLAAGGSMSSLSRESATVDRIEAVRRQLTGMRSIKQSTNGGNDVKLLEMLGEGSFGKVYRGVWRGTDVAVKTMVLPANMSGAEKREKMAIMEAAISSSLAHPNIVQTYTYFIKTVREEAQSDSDTSVATDGILVGGTDNSTVAGGSSLGKTFDEPSQQRTSAPAAAAVHGYEVRLVLEYCDRGCLRDALDGDAFLTATGVNFAGVLDTAGDIAKAMLHLHLADVLHGDLKARNVMLKSSGTEGRGVVGKVADFGLAVKIDTVEQTHMSGMYQGTLTHMAPELLLHGRMSKAVDVYAFGVTLWELFTGGHAFQGVPRALLGHQIAAERRRPAFPPFVPEAYVRLAEECWAHRPEDRPTFEVILERLAAMRDTLPGPAAPLAVYDVGAPPPPPTVLQPLPKLDGPQGLVSSTSNPVFDPHGSGSVGTGLVGGGSGSVSGSGSGINWAFAKSSHKTPLEVVEEDDRELDASSKKLPTINSGMPNHHNQQPVAPMEGIQEETSVSGRGGRSSGYGGGGSNRPSPTPSNLAPNSPLPSGAVARTAASLSQSGRASGSGAAP